MIVSVHQSHYLPWSGFFDKIDSADVFVVLDTVQFEKNGWQNRNRIKTAQGWMWLTVPVSHRFGASLAETEIAGTAPWAKKHLQALRTNYSKAPYFDTHIGFFEEVYGRDWSRLETLNDEMLRYFLDTAGISTEIVTASGLGPMPDDPSERLAAIVSELGGSVYLAGSGSKAYLDTAPFDRAGIAVVFQDYRPVEYTQLFGEFIPGLSIVDMLFNTGESTLDIIRRGRRTPL